MKNKEDKVARLERLELPTRCLEGSCSVHLSYRRVCINGSGRINSLAAGTFLPARGGESGRSDLNRRPPAPKAGALTRLRHSPLAVRQRPGETHQIQENLAPVTPA